MKPAKHNPVGKQPRELTPEGMRFIEVHTKMSASGLAAIMGVGTGRVKEYREELEQRKLSA